MKPGDLYLEIEFRPHKYYRAEGKDIYLDLPVAPWEAALDLKIPANSTSGKKMRLKGRGILGKKPGDLYIILNIALPPADTDKAKELYRKMEQELAFNPRADLGV